MIYSSANNETDLQVAMSLQSPVPIRGFDGKQTCTLRFEGDNLVPAQNHLGPIRIPLPQHRLDAIARHGNPQIQSLSLTLKVPCSVWYPHCLHGALAKHGVDVNLDAFVALSKATNVHVLFDSRWFKQDNYARLCTLISCTQELKTIPVDENFTRQYKERDSSSFGLVQDGDEKAGTTIEHGAPPSIEDAVYDAPPAYTRVSGKRSRQSKLSCLNTLTSQSLIQCSARTSSTPESPSPKRVLLLDVPSPTELATSPSSPSSPSPKPIAPTITSAHNLDKAITIVLEKVLPDMLRTQLSDMLPGMLCALPATLPSSTSPTSPSPSRHPNPKPSPTNRRLSINALLSTCVAAYPTTIPRDVLKHIIALIEQGLDNMVAGMIGKVDTAFAKRMEEMENISSTTTEHILQVYSTVRDELKDLLVESKLEIDVKLEDGVDDFNRQTSEKLDVLHDDTNDAVEAARERIEQAVDVEVDVALERLRELAGRGGRGLWNGRSVREGGQRSVSMPPRLA
jgi:hypothetical protein